MRIAIDARLNAYRQGGIPQYTRQLLTALADVARDDHQFISLQHRDHLRPLAVAPNVARRTVLTPPHHRFEPWAFPFEVLLARPHILHCPDFIAPVRRPCPAVVTIHDLAFLHYPDILDDSARAYYGQVKSNAARADAIIAVSEATRQDIAQFLDIPIDEIAMIHEAAAPLYERIELREGEARVLGSTPVAADTFMLFVSTLEPRKNLPTLLHALRICLDRRPDRVYRLVVAGSRGWRDETIFQTARDLRLGDHALFVGPVGQYDLRWLYNACRMYINPSLYEGFGLPLLEAMACGAPCLAAATSSLPEIGGNAALYIPPLDAGLWADAIEALWDDQERRAELGRLSRAQAQRFSWTRAARETLKIYQQVVERIGRPVPPAYAPRSERAQAELAAEPGIVAGSDKRACLRCGTPMLGSQLERDILVAEAALLADDRPQSALAWLCPRCGHVELVVARAVSEQTPASAAEESLAPTAEELETSLSGNDESLAPVAEDLDASPVVDDESLAPVAEEREASVVDDPLASVAEELKTSSAVDDEAPALMAEELDASPTLDDTSAPIAAAIGGELAQDAAHTSAANAQDTPPKDALDMTVEAVGSDSPPHQEQAPRAAITQLFELPAEPTWPSEGNDSTDGAVVSPERATVAEPDAPQTRPVAKPRARAVKNGTSPDLAPTLEPAKPSAAANQTGLPKKPRQPRSKRKRST
jgi:glycosyltransferase involved in cell wall biosynthesis